VMPTVLQLLGLPVPDSDGTGRLDRLAAGSIPDVDSFAVDEHGVRASVTRGRHRLVRNLGWDLYEGRPSPPGLSRLYEVVDGVDVPTEDPSLEAELRRSLDRWLEGQGLRPTGPA
jgi:hypothetical protein